MVDKRTAMLLMYIPVGIHWKGSLLPVVSRQYVMEVSAFLYLVREARYGPGKLGQMF